MRGKGVWEGDHLRLVLAATDSIRADGSGEAGEAMASPLFVSGGIYISESERTLACAAIQSTFRMVRD